MDQSDPLKKIIGRCTGPAWERIRSLRDDPLFDALVAALEQVEAGVTISQLHVESVYSTLNRPTGLHRSH